VYPPQPPAAVAERENLERAIALGPRTGVSVVIPAFNEVNAIGPQIDNVRQVMEASGWPFEIIVVDDGSSDGTSAAVRTHAVRLVQFPYNRGYGDALKAGIATAQNEWIVITDADGKDLPNISATPEIPEGSVAPAPLQADAHVQVVEGFDTVVTFKHTSDSYPDYRGKSESWWVNVGDNAPELVWRTAPPPHKERTVFVLTASSSDESGEAELYVNGTYALTFNIGAHLGSRSWERGAYHMTFASKQSIAGNSGIVLLDVPADQITPGKPVEIRVIPTKGTGDPWFMIKSYRDTIAHEQITPQLAADAIRGAWKSEAAAVAP